MTEQKDCCDVVGAIVIAAGMLEKDHPLIAKELKRAAGEYFDLDDWKDVRK